MECAFLPHLRDICVGRMMRAACHVRVQNAELNIAVLIPVHCYAGARR